MFLKYRIQARKSLETSHFAFQHSALTSSTMNKFVYSLSPRRLLRLGAQAAFFLYIGLVLFALFNYCSHCVETRPESLLDELKLPEGVAFENMCRPDFENLGLQEILKFDDPTEESIMASNPELQKGGRWTPSDCRPWQKVAIVIPYRNRAHPLKLLLRRLHPMLQRQKLHYRIILSEQAGLGQFNRGKLLNVGYLEAMKLEKFDCIVFHDTDLLPEDDRNLYMCDDHGRHLARAKDEHRYHVRYYNHVGGVLAIKAENVQRINGFANSYWGWGNEDDDFSSRITTSGMLLTRPPRIIGRYQTVPHKKSGASSGNRLFFGWKRRWATDGLNDTKGMHYTVLQVYEEPLYTRVSVDIGSPPPDMDIFVKDHTGDLSLFRFLQFYYP